MITKRPSASLRQVKINSLKFIIFNEEIKPSNFIILTTFKAKIKLELT